MKSNSCIYCGNNPVPHWIVWYYESLNIVLRPFRQAILYNFITRFFVKSGMGDILVKFFVNLAEKLGIISAQINSEECKIRRAQVLWEEAKHRGIAMRELLLFGKPFDCYEAKKNIISREGKTEEQTIFFSGLPRPQKHVNSRLDVMDDKRWLKIFFSQKGLPVPAGAAAVSYGQAAEIFKRIKKPVIVKPRSGSRGRHTTTFVSTEADLKAAYRVAKRLCYWVVVEEQLFGPVYRATVVNFKTAGVLRGDAPQVVGDGKHSIRELAEQKNFEPRLKVKKIITDASAELFLSRQGLSLSSVPKTGQTVTLSEKIGVNYGGSSSEDYDICHKSNLELFERAAKALGDFIVGFDFIISDVTRPWQEQACGFIEANSLPFINLHHDPLLGKSRNVAEKIWQGCGW